MYFWQITSLHKSVQHIPGYLQHNINKVQNCTLTWARQKQSRDLELSLWKCILFIWLPHPIVIWLVLNIYFKGERSNAMLLAVAFYAWLEHPLKVMYFGMLVANSGCSTKVWTRYHVPIHQKSTSHQTYTLTLHVHFISKYAVGTKTLLHCCWWHSLLTCCPVSFTHYHLPFILCSKPNYNLKTT